MNDVTPNLLLLGDPAQDEFRPTVEFIRRRVGPIRTRAASDLLSLAPSAGDEGWYPDLVVVLQAWPDQFSGSEIHQIISRFPLARIVCCFGPWCDSDGRTRSNWPLAVRVPAATAVLRIASELAALANADDPALPLPLTASRAEIFEFDFRPPAPQPARAATAIVRSPDRCWRQMLERAIAEAGLQVRAQGAADRLDFILFDADPWEADRAEALGELRGTHPHAKLVACVGFPRADLEAALCDAGADCVCFKLAPLECLLQARA